MIARPFPVRRFPIRNTAAVCETAHVDEDKNAVALECDCPSPKRIIEYIFSSTFYRSWPMYGLRLIFLTTGLLACS